MLAEDDQPADHDDHQDIIILSCYPSPPVSHVEEEEDGRSPIVGTQYPRGGLQQLPLPHREHHSRRNRSSS